MSLLSALVCHAERTPYYHLPGYMRRYWLLGARNIARNRDNISFNPAFAGGALYQWITDRVAIRLHEILRSDTERHLHNHPFSNVSIVLSGGYWEITPGPSGEVRKWRGPGAVVFRRASALHRLELLDGTTTWSVFIIGRKLQSWGFLIPWREYESGSK